MTAYSLALVAVYVPLAGLAAYRFARFLARDALIARTRQRLLDRTFVDGDMGRDPVPVLRDGFVHWPLTVLRWKAVYLLFCGFCNGFWLAGLAVAAITAASPLSAPLPLDLVHWFAAAGIAAALIRWDNGQPIQAQVEDVTKPRTVLSPVGKD